MKCENPGCNGIATDNLKIKRGDKEINVCSVCFCLSRKCEGCNEEEQLYLFTGSKMCMDCWYDYWDENGIGEYQSFEDFKSDLKKI